MEFNSHLNGCKVKISLILLSALDSFCHPLDSQFLKGYFGSRWYDFIRVLKMDLGNSEFVKVT